jgi:hypothetical protein
MIGLKRAARIAATVFMWVGASGCLSMGTVQTADTLGKGNWQVAVEPGVYGLQATDLGGRSEGVIVPHFDLAFRYGVVDRVDIGVRTGSSLIELQTKFLLTDPMADTLAMSVAPTVGGIFLGSTSSGSSSGSITYFNVGVPLLVGIKHWNGNELVFGPRLNNIFLTAGSGSGGGVAYLFGVGGTVGYCFSIGEIFKILPEFAINVPVAAALASSAGGGSGTGIAGLIYQFKVGLQFGRTGHKPPPLSTSDLPPPPPPPAASEVAPLPPPPPPPPAP